MMGAMAEAEGIAGLDTSVAHPARVYDYWLGGTDNFAADREAAERVLAVTPGLRFRVRANRAAPGRGRTPPARDVRVMPNQKGYVWPVTAADSSSLTARSSPARSCPGTRPAAPRCIPSGTPGGDGTRSR